MQTQEKRLQVGKWEWFYREAEPFNATDKPPVILLHGLPAQSYSWREVLPALASQGMRAIAPDWLGFGFSAKPDRREFRYTADAFVQALAELIDQLEIERFSLVVQGFVGSSGLLYALRYPEKIERLAILNAPLSPEARVPWKIKQLGLPLMGEMLTQDPLLVDRTLEGGGKYQVADKDLDIYRAPFLKSSAAGRSLFATVQNLRLAEVTSKITSGFANWTQPTQIIWGINDPWLPVSQAEAFAQMLNNVELVRLAEVGHYPQEDWPEKVNEALVPFLRRQIIE
ncbi:alpha/beta fold hydrolase [Desertifilum sp. FACHB-1129]|uniref:alpha/beta fold hydrolase n=1 Tax=Desertifilum TaxID=1185872 RepID=UPI00114D0A2F|nr:alpha/beta fold hydrolase [Desertifilum sp. FACHB-1129]MBD2324621.1 alpha/beta fold hydrolase [Desertifilum sp. FACHB-866]MBD2334712.1 alpha/beta fold hydrolase [Desertifilum sp. FACHB-868]MDA0209465.1 alpha/beta fold hydrolase [Cyanobacteria bacterium FC1]